MYVRQVFRRGWTDLESIHFFIAVPSQRSLDRWSSSKPKTESNLFYVPVSVHVGRLTSIGCFIIQRRDHPRDKDPISESTKLGLGIAFHEPFPRPAHRDINALTVLNGIELRTYVKDVH